MTESSCAREDESNYKTREKKNVETGHVGCMQMWQISLKEGDPGQGHV